MTLDQKTETYWVSCHAWSAFCGNLNPNVTQGSWLSMWALPLDLRCLQLGLPRRSPRPERRATGGPSVQLSEWVAGGSGDAQGGKTRGREGGRGRMTSEIQGWKYEVRREDLP